MVEEEEEEEGTEEPEVLNHGTASNGSVFPLPATRLPRLRTVLASPMICTLHQSLAHSGTGPTPSERIQPRT